MRRMVLSCVLCLLTVGAARAQSANSRPLDASTRAELLAAREAVWRAWYAGDTTRLGRILPGALAAGSPGGWDARAATVGQARDFAAHGGRLIELRFDSTTITVHGRVAVLQALYRTVVEERGGKHVTNRGFATEVFVKEKTGWVNPFWYLDDPGS